MKAAVPQAPSTSGLRSRGTSTGTSPASCCWAWVASDEGVAFTTASSDAWCAAAIVAGDPPDEARAAADRTTAAYTGR